MAQRPAAPRPTSDVRLIVHAPLPVLQLAVVGKQGCRKAPAVAVIRFALPMAGEVELTLLNLAGQRVATLVQGIRDTGTYAVRWDGRDDAGQTLASGVYLYRLQAGAQVQTRKLLLVR